MITKRLCLSLLSLMILTSCSMFFPEVKEDRPLIIEGLNGKDRQFTLAGLPSYVQEDNVYRIEDEKELALLSIIQERENVLKVFYVSDNPISIDKTFAYIESVIPYPFNITMTEIPYTRNGEVLTTLFSIEIMPNDENYEVIFDTGKAWNQSIIKDGMSDKEKIKAIHDEIVLVTQYDTSILDIDLSASVRHPSFEATGVFNYNTAVCSGYSRAFNVLAHDQGIPSIMVSSISMLHAWNLVYDGLSWKFIDTTFNDPIPDRQNRVLYTYYLLNKNQFIQDGKHTFDKSSDTTLSAEEYIEFAEYVYPETKQ
ncbi:MAG TPA: transglutaminase domain-containing protein [Erysipelotrichaceae bacterium]|nr:transglutaminase domain-containing protein [Erysipelotrichaceae bacterium]